MASLVFGRMWRPFASTGYRDLRLAFALFPREVGGFTGTDQALGDRVAELAGMDRWLRREYRAADGGHLIFYVAYYGNRDRGLQTIYHNPTVCYPAAGYAPGESRVASIPGGAEGPEVPVDLTVYRSSTGSELLVGSFFVLDEKRASARPPRNEVVALGFEKLRPSVTPGYFVQVQVVAAVRRSLPEATAMVMRFLTAAVPPLFEHF
jgi:EpsI family protein